MIADKMIVDTKKENCAPCKFIIGDISEGWTYEYWVKKRRREGTGTTKSPYF